MSLMNNDKVTQREGMLPICQKKEAEISFLLECMALYYY